ncbi:glutathione S-transferase domain-containing protein [Loa loa]|uniref:Glutathione S-transferase omega n=1 Tax=Loa loa TaxID=7209 RepID=A0A1S0TMZ9_LOALO|nr:glutathione S-transferase domain-containing protein [Loa loa]EFO17107.1 glutathione S-transferase domain-containing protein [Loa loa]
MFNPLLIWILCLSSVNIAVVSKLVGFTSKILQQDDPEPSPGDNIRIYSMRFCPYCDRVIIAAYKKGLQFEVLNINLQNKPGWFLSKHPEGTVPVLEHDGKLVSDSRVIIEYLDDAFPETSILPKEPYLRAKQRYYAIKLESVCNTIHKVSYLTKLSGNITILAIELAKAEELLQSPFYSDTAVGLPDIMLYPFIQRLHVIRQFVKDNFLDDYFPNNFPKLVKWFVKMRTMPEIQIVRESERHLKAFLISKAKQNATDFDVDLSHPNTPINWKFFNNSTIQ